MPYKISVVIPTYNRLAILKKTLMYIGNQSIGRDQYQIIVIDDGSTDGTNEYLKTLNDIDYFKNNINKGRAVTRNIGINSAKSDLILFIDDDIWADYNLLVEHLKSHGRDVDVVVGAIKPSTEVNKTVVNAYMDRHHDWCCQEMLKNKNNLPFTFLKTANVSIPKKVFDKVGIFNESFYHYGGEDTELGYRIQINDIPIIYNPNAVGYHQDNETIDKIVDKELARAKSLYLLKSLIAIRQNDDSYDGFFIPKYHRVKSIRAILYNVAKWILFMPYVKDINKMTIKGMIKLNIFNKFLVNVLIPILKLQYLYYGQKNEAKDRN